MKHIICGVVSVLLGVWGIIVWWYEFGAVMRGIIPFTLLIVGIIAVTAGIQTQQDDLAGSTDDIVEDAVEVE